MPWIKLYPSCRTTLVLKSSIGQYSVLVWNGYCNLFGYSYVAKDNNSVHTLLPQIRFWFHPSNTSLWLAFQFKIWTSIYKFNRSTSCILIYILWKSLKKTKTKTNTDLWTAFYIANHPDRKDNHIDIYISSEYLSKLQFLYFVWPFPWIFYIILWHLSTTKRLAWQNAERFCIVLEWYVCIGTVMKWSHSGNF